MAWIFSLSAECGSDENSAHTFARHFEGISWVLSNGRECQCSADIFQDIEENWWCRVSPNNLSEVGIDSPESAYLMTELGILLYQSLRFASPFRYALVGVEVDEFRTYNELIEDLSDLSIPGLVLAKALHQELKTLPVFRSFSPNYVWQPYAGEIYNPLMASPNLKNKLNELLAAS
ncbi:hypothetical protein V2H45_12405 [Tumidithrix elongata RA019]|uniref:Uncharacterized protein n=1 Tax=Tumidithrix elongata BACA0141 TaxID=2716417 RepID=A0AAW9PX13_9CYAN|nr:hypothetical protein [Tumidithrix elongata RA019]